MQPQQNSLLHMMDTKQFSKALVIEQNIFCWFSSRH